MSRSTRHLNTFIPSIGLSILGILIIYCILTHGNCHISSVLNGAGHDGKAPLSLNHIRLSRGPNVPTVPHSDDEEGSASSSRLHFLKPPTYQHKYLQRLSQFHGNDRGFGSLPIVDVTGYTNGVWTDNAGAEPEQGVQSEETYSPYIGARALSNIPEFFAHLKANIEAIKEQEKEKESGQDHGASLEEPWFPENSENNQWNPVSVNRYRTFHHQPLDRPRHNNYNPSWQYTNLGLGRRR